MGIDPAFGSGNSKFAITVTCLVDDKIRVIFSEEFEQPSHETMVELAAGLIERYNYVHCYIDAANPGFISSLKSTIGEDPKYQDAITRYKAQHVQYELNMKVLPINFSTDHKSLLSNMKMLFLTTLLSLTKSLSG